MGILQIKQKNKKGQSKVWKVDSKQKRVTFGTSRKSNMSSIDPTHSPFQAVFEYSNDKWHLIQFDADCKNPSVEISDQFQYDFANSTLYFHMIEKPEFVSHQMDMVQTSGPLQRKIVLVSRGKKLLQADVYDVETPFHYGINGTKHLIPFKNSTDWDHHSIEDFNFKSKLIQVEDLNSLARIPGDKIIDRESKKLVYATLLSMFLFVFVGLFASKPEMVVNAPIPTSAQSLVVKMEEKKKKPKTQTVSMKRQTAPKNNAAAGAASSNKVNAMLKGAIGARISQLIGKVSSTDARTANVIATSQGIKAGEGPSGRALSAVGNMNTSGRNWNGEAVGSGGGVGTAGIAGGKGTSGLGSGLAAGKTGSGGVGLLEDESEVEGGLDRDIIAQYIKSQLGQLLSCYDRQLVVQKDLRGKVSVKFVISGTGQVITQNIAKTEMNNQPTESCVLSKIAKWKFPEPKGGTKVVVTYPFKFESTN